jgi:hypothetical protein
MAIKFNPLTGNFDFTGSGGGGGSSYIDGEVAVYADLPLDGSAALNSAWLVRTASGVWPVSRKQAGIYIRTATGGSNRDSDYTYAGTMPDVFSDSQFLLYDNSDTSKNLAFDLGNITTGTTRTLTAPNASGRIQIEGQPIGNTTPAAGTFTTLALPTGSAVGSASAPALSIGAANTGIYISGNQLIFTQAGADRAYFDNSGRFFVTGAGGISIGATGSPLNFTRAISLNPDANGELHQRSTTQSQSYFLYNTFTSSTNHERGFLKWSSNVFQIGTEKGSAGGSARTLEFQTDGVTRFTLATNGAATFSAGVTCVGISSTGGGISTNQTFTLSSNFTMSSQVLTATLDCTSNPAGIRLYGLGNTGGSATNTERLHISTRSGASYFISTQATGTGTARALEIRTADVARLTFEAAGGLTIADANNIAVGTTTGTKIGTATSQKIGFFNATPVVQQAAVADATDAASTQDRLNDLLARLRTLGLIAT